MKREEKRLISIIVLLIFAVQILFVPIKVKAEGEGINVEASSALLMEPISGKIIYEKNPHEKFAPASVTKIMTMLIAMEAIDSGKIKLTDKITVSENAKMKGKGGNSSMLLDTGEIRTVEEILKGIAIASGNDAATAMAEYIGGSEEAFVKMMNDKAESLGMKNTSFKNCSGLSAPGHLTTAYDIALMSRELLRHPKVLKYTGTYMETISEGRKSPIGLVNHNKLVRFFKGCDGLKTGFTNEAKYCISATAVRDGVRMLAVIMGAPTYKVRNRDASMLMNHGFSKFECKKILTKDSNVEKIQLGKRDDKFFMAKALEDLNVVVERGSKNKITKKCVVNLDKKHYNKGEVIGYCEVYLNENLIGKGKIYCDREIKKSGFFDNLKYNFNNLFNNGI
ncbi:D-alanyl-D-alanine carboxypeptidase (penicillin-binding protein 5/6) [Clostridium tetanomorphum]|uniref:serine-type D-Ala-D-Ala carboxypeptidase n=1 Tax=Clostridium tetanomorphum TaxID=1553 RepID=A0A923E568_CLOTT|nr:D-alanyl-D-alanine carboxypeptidase family protein [Clostridium tetanomorphum]KAJ51460.1 D-alanyl-D-alanine carboxypeptidase [Clostridium tetanomorphum DSM 665]MBC2396553.1 D-alanyl-D-alanine carboxypeptidase [Clostridium tetanomorphum]MBP1863880.1 D-alanyl-D-alanine carboxypeptidase (penicillin-binding protein 5/6) [Clostridium tetanomorphum]NRS84958.1 D-alanyl-D-alanine carboxypeptidase (penicillin-binding protein 5/6) [Clostridium tetanomorphum]NRZ98174.1 D-alanyl-D-alanine carboxypeptid